VTVVDQQFAPGELAPGQVHGDVVGTATSAVRLGQLRPEGRASMAAADWLRGLRLATDERFT